MNGTVFLVAGLAALAAGVAVFAASAVRVRRGRTGWWLLATALISAGLLGVITGWLLGEPNPNRGEALKTGGIAAGSVVALYALWLNDRRRRVDEERQEIERRRQDLEFQRNDHDRERVADDRFARAVELLGDDADQVRVGALHALAGLARSRPSYTQTVLDVLCAYLRRPFARPTDDADMDQHERQVRITAQRLISDLLHRVDDPDAQAYDLDLTGADLEYFDLSERVVGRLILRRAVLYSSNALWKAEIRRSAWFTGAVSHGILHAHGAEFRARAWFSGFTAHEPVNLSGARFLGQTKFSGATFWGKLDLSDTTMTDVEAVDALASKDSALPEGWEAKPVTALSSLILVDAPRSSLDDLVMFRPVAE